MPDDADILISLHARHVRTLLNGEKSVELRRRAIKIPAASRVWIYGTRPLASIQAVGLVGRIDRLPPDEIWLSHGSNTGVTEQEFRRYFEGIKVGSAIVFDEVIGLTDGPTLAHLRAQLGSFQPPQFFRRLDRASPELALLRLAAPDVRRSNGSRAHSA
jgi:predicted transcriptional regulator